LAEKLFHREGPISFAVFRNRVGEISDQREWKCRPAAIRMPILLVGAPLAHFLKTKALC